MVKNVIAMAPVDGLPSTTTNVPPAMLQVVPVDTLPISSATDPTGGRSMKPPVSSKLHTPKTLFAEEGLPLNAIPPSPASDEVGESSMASALRVYVPIVPELTLPEMWTVTGAADTGTVNENMIPSTSPTIVTAVRFFIHREEFETNI